MTSTDPQPENYLRVSAQLFDNPKLLTIAEAHGPCTWAAWVYILCSAKRAKKLGKLTAPPSRIARMIMAPVDVVADIIEALVEERCLTVIADDTPHHYQVRNWARWQSMTPGERSRKYRENRSSETVTDTVTGERDDETPDTQTKQDKTKQYEKTNPLVERSAEIREVFEHWVAVDTETGGGAERRVLTTPRRSKINARLDEGYTVDQLKQSITAFCHDDFHLGKNDRGTRYTGLTTLLKSGEKVEAGLAKVTRISANDIYNRPAVRIADEMGVLHG